MKRVVLASLISLLIIGAIALGYFYYQQLKTPSLEAVNAIPTDAAFIVETKDASATWKSIRESSIWNELKNSSYFSALNRKGVFIDSLFSKGRSVSKLYEAQTVFISAHIIKANDFDFLYLVNLPKIGQESFVNDVIKDVTGGKADISKRVYDGVTIKDFPAAGNNESFSYAVVKGVFIGSFTAFLVEDAIRQLHMGKPFTLDKSFTKVFDAAGSKVDANIFVNFNAFPNLLSAYLNIGGADQMKNFRPFASWAGLDLKFKNNTISLNGFTSAENKTDFLNIMKGQKPGETKMLRILPAKTVVFVHQYVSDFNLYRQNYKNFLSENNDLDAYKDSLKRYTDLYRLNVEERMLNWVGNEMALVISQGGGNTLSANTFMVLHTKDLIQAKSSLDQLSRFASLRDGITTENYKDNFPIKYLGLSGIFGICFGNVFSGIENSYYTFLGDYVVFANQPSSLKNFIDDYQLKKVLSNHPEYKSLSENLSQRSNCYVYANMSSVANVLKVFASSNLEKSINLNVENFNKFESFAFQLSAGQNNNDLFYNNIVINQHTTKKEEINQLWASKLDTSISMQPILVVNHNTDIKEIMVQDDANNLYLMDNSGEILWKKKIPGHILGSIRQIDYYRNGKLQYLFNTSKMLYLLDRNSDNVANFPIKLAANASAGLSVFDYDKKLDYRIFIPCGKKIYTYQTSGKPVEGWVFNKSLENVYNQVQHFRIDSKDYLIISDGNGQVFFLDRKGENRFPVKDKIFIAKNSPWQLVNEEKPYFANVDSSGTIYHVFTDGSIDKIQVDKMDNLAASFSYLCMDVDADKLYDHIFLDRDKLYAFKADKTLLFVKNFEQEILNRLQFVEISKKDFRIGISSEKTNEIFMIDADGSVSSGFPLKGSTLFSTGDLNNDGHINLVAGSSDGNIYVYTLK